MMTPGDTIRATGYLVTEVAYCYPGYPDGKTYVIGPCCNPEQIEFHDANSFELSPREYFAFMMKGQL